VSPEYDPDFGVEKNKNLLLLPASKTHTIRPWPRHYIAYLVGFYMAL